MTDTHEFTEAVSSALPFLRRYARALTGTQQSGDQYAAATLEAVLEDRTSTMNCSSVKVGLFQVFHTIWNSSGAPIAEGETGLKARAQAHLSRLTANSREALLLHTIEDFSIEATAEVMGLSVGDAEDLVNTARVEMQDAIAGSVMIIEDEPIIAMDLETVVADMGHRVTGVARTQSEAASLASSDLPDLILSDIQLADQSSGIDAVNEILGEHGSRPVIFITAYPERLLTGERAEPAFLITKPYTEAQVRSAVSQAMFFSSTETLQA
ncbi:MAG: response regulator [Pseudomonadota bacterium]